MKRGINAFYILLLSIAITDLSSCGVSLPSFSRQNQTNSISINNAFQVEALKREDYTSLRTTSGSASTSRLYVLFIPIGKYKSDKELYENAYYDAVDNLPNADALILPRQQNKKFTIPLILVNYDYRAVKVTGLGISVKDKVMENVDSDVPYTIAQNYSLKSTFDSKQLKSPKINTQMGFDKVFQSSTTDNNSEPTGIDFSKQYVIAVIGKATKNNSVYSVNNLKLKENLITLYYKSEDGEKQSTKVQPYIILVVDKKYQGNIRLKERE